MNNILSSIGLCRRAGFTIHGFDSVIKESNSKNSKIEGILVTCDISEKTLKELRFKTKNKEILKIPATIEEVEKVFKKPVAIIGITDVGFYKTFKGNTISSNKNLGET